MPRRPALPSLASRSGVAPYVRALAACAIAALLKSALDPILGDKAPFLLFFGSVMVIAVTGGFWPGIVATAVALLVTTYAFVEPYWSLAAARSSDLVLLAIFAVEGVVISVLGGTLLRNAEQAERARATAVRQEHQIREEANVVETLHRIGLSLASEREQEKLVQAVTDATTSLAGAQFGAFFYNVVAPDGESYTLYTISGVPRERFANFPMPRNTAVFAPTFAGEGVVRLDDVTQDPRYGKNAPYHGMPLGHLPVRSYLAVPIVGRDREVLGGLFFGHAEPGRFTERHERVVVGLASYAAVAMQNAALYAKLEDAVREEQEARARVEAANRTKDEFLATVSHELRTPLTPILAWARLLRDRTLPPETARRAVETIERAARSQAQLVEDLLDVSRIISGKLRLDIRKIEVGPVIEAAIESLRLAAEAKGVHVEVALGERAGLVSADPERIQQVVWNLLSNAIKFTPRGGHVRISTGREASSVAIEVRDTGQGISPAFLPHVFERFQQADAGTTRAHGGLGLGLAIVRHMVELHGGTVRVASAGEGKGTTFNVTLPLAAVQSVAGVPDGDRGSAAAPFAASARLAGLKILVVDDERDTVDTIAAVLELSGARTQGALSAGEGLARLVEWRPDVLISDIGMPGEDGLSLIRRIRDLPATAGGLTPAVALTAYARVEDRIRVLAAGFQMHVAKPVEPAELIATIESVRAGDAEVARDRPGSRTRA